MKNIYVMIVISIVFFILSIDILFYTNTIFDIALVLIYLILVGQSALNLESDIKEIREEYILREKSTAYFAPLIFMPFLGMTYEFGIIALIVNLLVIVLLYIYIYISINRNEIKITKDEVSVVYLNNKTDSIVFKDVVKVEFNWFYNYIGLSDSKDHKVILDITLKNFCVVIRGIKDNLPKEMYYEAFNRLAKFYTIFLLKSNIKYL